MASLTDITYIKSLLSRHGFTFSKGLGQNFLINPDVCPMMAEMCGADKNSGVLEIGAGVGVLTRELALVSKKTVCVELDSRLLPVLSETLDGYDNINIINEDIMKVDLAALLKREFYDCGINDIYVCANLPYYITSPVIMLLLESGLDFSAMTFMVQKEAADRLAAEVGSRESGAVTVAVAVRAKAETLFDVASGSFMPAPKVNSAVIKLTPHKEPIADIKDLTFFTKVVRSAFGQRRKTFVNSVSSLLHTDKADIAAALKNAGLSETIRAEAMSLNELAEVAESLRQLVHE